MTYTACATVAVIAAVTLDLVILRTRLVRRRTFWVSYAIVVVFQLISNAAFTGYGIVKYHGAAILGADSPAVGAPPFLGGGRIAYAPVEDLAFGFALVLLSISLWRYIETKRPDGITAGPPRIKF